MLELAGVTPAELGAATRSVLNKFTELLKAQRVTRLVVSQGRDEAAVVAEYPEPDTAMQLRAAEGLTDILGLKPSRSQGINTGGGPVNIRVSFAERPVQVIDVKPQ